MTTLLHGGLADMASDSYDAVEYLYDSGELQEQVPVEPNTRSTGDRHREAPRYDDVSYFAGRSSNLASSPYFFTKSPAKTMQSRDITRPDKSIDAIARNEEPKEQSGPTTHTRAIEPRRNRRWKHGEGGNSRYDKLEDAPSLNMPLPNGNLTAAEILAFFPQWLKSWDVVERFTNNGGKSDTYACMINTFRNMPRGEIAPNSVYRMMKSAVAHRKEPRYNDWSVGRHQKPANWDGNILSTTGFRLPCNTHPLGGGKGKATNAIPPAIAFKELAAGLKQMPDGFDALDLTRCVKWHVANPEQSAWFPNDFVRLSRMLGGPRPVLQEHLDGAAFERWKNAKSRHQKREREERKQATSTITTKKRVKSNKRTFDDIEDTTVETASAELIWQSIEGVGFHNNDPELSPPSNEILAHTTKRPRLERSYQARGRADQHLLYQEQHLHEQGQPVLLPPNIDPGQLHNGHGYAGIRQEELQVVISNHVFLQDNQFYRASLEADTSNVNEVAVNDRWAQRMQYLATATGGSASLKHLYPSTAIVNSGSRRYPSIVAAGNLRDLRAFSEQRTTSQRRLHSTSGHIPDSIETGFRNGNGNPRVELPNMNTDNFIDPRLLGGELDLGFDRVYDSRR